MDIDRFIARNQPAWERLRQLTEIGHSDASALGEVELDELIQLYQRTSAQLSYARTYFDDAALTALLTRRVAEASSLMYGRRTRSVGAVRTFFRDTFPAAVWHNGRFVALAAGFFFVPAAVMLVWLVGSPEALEVSAPAAYRESYADELFEDYYSNQPSAQFATLVGVNNVQVSFLAFAGGASAMLPGLFVLVLNGLRLGEAAAWMTTEGRASTFWLLIAPHGLTELSAIVVSGAAGLRVGWTMLVPGEDRTRAEALAEEGRRAGAILLGLMVFFAIAAVIEGFVTGSALAIQVKVAIGVLAWIASVMYVVTFGRDAALRGVTGMLGPARPSWETQA